MFNNERVGVIEEYENKSYWQKLTDYYSRMSADQQIFVSNSKNVLKAKTNMMEAFNLFLFERYKDEFIKLNDFRKLCDEYIDTVIKAGQKYSEETAKAASENKTLKAKVAELERKLNEQQSNAS